MKKILYILLSCTIILVSSSYYFKKFSNTYDAQLHNEVLRNKISQMIVIGYENDKEFKSVIKSIKKNEISGVIFYKRNIKSKEKIIKTISTLNSYNATTTPLFMMLDQEGGQVSRINRNNGFQYYPDAEFVARNLTLKEANKLYTDMAKSLSEVGFNFNLAPCIDIKHNEKSSIGSNKRSYGNNAETVSKYAKEFIIAHNSQGIITALKHYPGIGSASADSHKTLPDITKTWSRQDIIPFKTLLKEFPNEPIMSAHVINKEWDSKNINSMSKKSLSYLSEQLNHNGIILMDATDMDAIQDSSIEDIIIKGINSGINLFMFPNHVASNNLKIYMKPEIFISIIINAIETGKINQQQIDISYKKIINLKLGLKNNEENHLQT